jgi:hypothetical protein
MSMVELLHSNIIDPTEYTLVDQVLYPNSTARQHIDMWGGRNTYMHWCVCCFVEHQDMYDMLKWLQVYYWLLHSHDLSISTFVGWLVTDGDGDGPFDESDTNGKMCIPTVAQ